MATLEELVVKIGADLSDMNAGFVDVKRKLDGLESKAKQSTQSVETSFSGMASRLKGLLVGGAAVAGISFLTNQIIGLAQTASQLKDFSDALGISAEQLQVYNEVAAQGGVNTAQFNSAMQRFATTVGNAATGSQQAVDLFNALGISIKNANGEIRPTGDILNDVSEALSKIESPAERAAIGADLFGRGSQLLTQALSAGNAEIEKTRANLENFGALVSDADIARIEASADRIEGAFRKIQNIAINALADVIQFFELAGGYNATNNIEKINQDIFDAQSEITRLQRFSGRGESTRVQEQIKQQEELIKAKQKELELEFEGARKRVFADKQRPTTAARTSIGSISGNANLAKPSQTQNKTTDEVKKTSNEFLGLEANIISADEQMQNLKKTTEGFSMVFESAFENAIVSGEGFSGVLKGLEQDLLRMATRALVVQPLLNFGKQALGGVLGGGFGSLFGGSKGVQVYDSPIGPSLPAGRAIGGQVNAGQAYMVGEKGPELFMPKTTGMISPNGSLGIGGGSVTVQQTININQGVDAAVAAQFRQAAPIIAEQAKTAVWDAMKRGVRP